MYVLLSCCVHQANVRLAVSNMRRIKRAAVSMPVCSFSDLLLQPPTLFSSISPGVLAFSFGLRHAVDADHIAAIDNVTRKLIEVRPRDCAVLHCFLFNPFFPFFSFFLPFFSSHLRSGLCTCSNTSMCTECCGQRCSRQCRT